MIMGNVCFGGKDWSNVSRVKINNHRKNEDAVNLIDAIGDKL